MEQQRKSVEKKRVSKKEERQSSRRGIDDGWQFGALSTLPTRDFEQYTVTTVATVKDYVSLDRGSPRDGQFIDKIVAVPIPTEKGFVTARQDMTDFLEEIGAQQDAPFVLHPLETDHGESFVVLQLRERYFPESPARVVVLPKESDRRTYGMFTTEKMLPIIREQFVSNASDAPNK